jgi:hypothetical protein
MGWIGTYMVSVGSLFFICIMMLVHIWVYLVIISGHLCVSIE